nr:DUF2510 domain-containing protein [Actinomycetales bacterium]
MSINPGSGWFTDPNDPRSERYFDGRAWTNHVRADVPDIPLAPWVDPQSIPSLNGLAVDTSAPTNNSATWLSLGLAAAGVVAAFTTGILQTNAGIAEGMGSEPGIRLVDPPEGGSGTPLYSLLTCPDLVGPMMQFEEAENTLDLTGQFGTYRLIHDNQPIFVLPADESEVYRILECTVEAERTDGSVRTAFMLVYTTHEGQLTIDYGDL